MVSIPQLIEAGSHCRRCHKLNATEIPSSIIENNAKLMEKRLSIIFPACQGFQ
jgi:hypothetical protein